MFALTYCFSFLRGGQDLPNSRPNGVMLAPCWHIFRSWAPFFGSQLLLKHFLDIFDSSWSFFSCFGSLRARFLRLRGRISSIQTIIINAFWRQQAYIIEMLLIQQNISFCDVLLTSDRGTHSHKTLFLHSFVGIFGHGARIAAKNPCWHSLSALHNHPAARRYVRSTWNWSQVGS